MKIMFTTYDLFLSAALVALGYSVVSVDKTDRKHVAFDFEREHGLDEAIQSFWAKQLHIEPQLLFTSLKMLKSRIYSE